MRADKFFAEKFGSRTKAAEALEKGWVVVGGKVLRPKDEVPECAEIVFMEDGNRFVSNGGYKLARAFEKFDLVADGLVFVDIGACNVRGIFRLRYAGQHQRYGCSSGTYGRNVANSRRALQKCWHGLRS